MITSRLIPLIAFLAPPGEKHLALGPQPLFGDTMTACSALLARTTKDSTRLTLWISVRGPHSAQPLPGTYGNLVAEGVKQSLVLPPLLSLGSFALGDQRPLTEDSARSPADSLPAHPVVEGYYAITLRWNGTISTKSVVA